MPQESWGIFSKSMIIYGLGRHLGEIWGWHDETDSIPWVEQKRAETIPLTFPAFPTIFREEKVIPIGLRSLSYGFSFCGFLTIELILIDNGTAPTHSYSLCSIPA